MATRPSPASDAAIRAQYYRGTRRSPQAQAIAQNLERTGVGESLAVSRWNRGEDPALQAVSRANAATAARGFSAAAADRGRAMQSVNEALQAQPDSSLPPTGRAMFGRMQSRLPGNAEEFLRDADEYSGRSRSRKTMEYRSSGREVKEPSQTMEYRRRGVSEGPALRRLNAEDYWDQNSEFKPTAVAKDWSADPEVAAAIATGNVSAIEQATKNARDRDRVGRGLPKGPGTTEGDTTALAGNTAPSAPSAASVREVDAAGLADRAKLLDKLRETGRNRGAELQANQLAAELRKRGVTTEPRLEDGSFDVNKARGMLAQATFQGWENDKTLERQAKQLSRDRQRERSYLRRAQDGVFGIAAQDRAMEPEQQARLRQLDTDLGKGYGRDEFWRKQVETLDRAETSKRNAENNIVEANNATSASMRENRDRLSAIMNRLLEKMERGTLTDAESRQMTQISAFMAASGKQQ